VDDFLISYQEGTCSVIENTTELFHIDNNMILLFAGKTERYTIESMLIAYQTEGISFINNIESSFTLFIYDKPHQKIFLAKDKIGLKPLFFSQYDNTILISTRLKKFQEISTFNAKINTDAVAHYLQYGLILQPHTIFENCYKVQAGHTMEFDITSQQHSTQAYWSLESCYHEKKSLFNEQSIIQQSKELLNEALHNRMHHEGNHGFSLSGGYDSSTLVAMAQANSEAKINTFTIGFKEESINEAPDAKRIAHYLGTNHTEYYFDAKDALEIIPTISQIYDEPFADHAVAPTLLSSQLMKKANITHLIAGDGGDEVFATADDLKNFELVQKFPKLLKQTMALSLQKLPSSKKYKNQKAKLSQMLLANNIASMIKVRKGLFLEEELTNYIKGIKPKVQTSFEAINFNQHAEVLDQIIGTYFKTTMTDGELVKSHTSMSHNNIHLSTPFLDTKLIAYLAKVPSSIKVKNSIKKYLLKEIAHQYLPKKLMERPKSGFDIPFSAWMRNELKYLLYLQVNKERLDKDNIFYTSSILHIRDQFYAGNNSYKYKLWRLFIFQLWYENFKRSNNKG